MIFLIIFKYTGIVYVKFFLNLFVLFVRYKYFTLYS